MRRKQFDITIDGMRFQGILELRQPNGVPLLKINGQRMEYQVFNQLKRNLDATTVSFNFPSMWIPGWRWLISPMSDIASKIVKLIDALGYEQVDVLGVSWGGALAIELAALYPARVRKLVLISTTARPYRMLHPAVLHAYFNKGYGGKSRYDPMLQVEVKSSAGSSSFFTDFYRGVALPFWFGVSRLPFIKQETLIVCGDDDTITPLREARFMERQIRRARLEVLADEGHLAVYSSAKLIADHVNQFLMEFPTTDELFVRAAA